MTCRRSLSRGSESFPANPQPLNSTSIPSPILVANLAARTTKSTSSHQNEPRKSIAIDYSSNPRRNKAGKKVGIRISHLSRLPVIMRSCDWPNCPRPEVVSFLCFIPVPTILANSNADTLWASGYEVYHRLSTPYQRFLESLTATFAQPKFTEAAEKNGFKIYSEPRDALENVGEVLEVIHPVIRTNPVTGWKSVFAAGHYV